ncbi:hypothetical protein NPIL_521221 [Nephila pilipes]|uniref:Uncharacterized protein n=1 Tax=Nephila pilipes TaxID=299642 RepID=A0A8X6NHJ3_NEPPI|nr:hypothetical protein NPIL_521221 [Nephila pilipes]
MKLSHATRGCRSLFIHDFLPGIFIFDHGQAPKVHYFEPFVRIDFSLELSFVKASSSVTRKRKGGHQSDRQRKRNRYLFVGKAALLLLNILGGIREVLKENRLYTMEYIR